MGLVRTAALLGLVNLAVAFVAMRLMADSLRGRRAMQAWGVIIGVVLSVVFATAGHTTSWAEDQLYDDPIVLPRPRPISAWSSPSGETTRAST